MIARAQDSPAIGQSTTLTIMSCHAYAAGMRVEAEEIIIPALLRAARAAYGDSVRERLAAGGFDDLPRNGPYVVGGMANHGRAAGELVRDLGISKQATSQLIDTLVLRGYLTRAENPDDRRRLTIKLTDRGREAAGAVRAGVEAVDEQLAARISANDCTACWSGSARWPTSAGSTEQPAVRR
jgi:DNA-binding HxlR family transcriptional regulator